MSRTDHTELLKRAATFLGELLIDNRVDADQIAAAKALHDDLMAAVQHQPEQHPPRAARRVAEFP